MNNETRKPEQVKSDEQISWKGIEKYFATEVIEQSKVQAKRWFIAWIVTLIALIGTNTYWIYVFNSYEYVDQYGDGVNNVNSGSQGDVLNEPASED